MNELLISNVEFIWSKECAETFELLKQKLDESPILWFPDWLNKFHFHIDTLAILVEAILSQPYDEGIDHPNAYTSQKLKKPK